MSTADGYYRDVASPEEVSSSYAVAWRLASEDSEEELELDLSLGAKKSGGDGRAGSSSGPWRRHCRILTANDFPSMVDPEVVSNTPKLVVGWPPIRAYRINSLFGHSMHGASENNGVSQAKDPNEHTSGAHHKGTKNKGSKETATTSKDCEKKHGSSHFVKVNMDGAPIGRKVDLNAHRSYDTLALALEDIFQKPTGLKAMFRSKKVSKLLDGSSEFVLTYKDKDGDWMLVGDVPWGMFLSTAKRLRIMRSSDANGLVG